MIQIITRQKLALLVCLSACFSFAQQTLKGQLVDEQTKEPVEFANIGIIGKGIGTVTDEKGRFALLVPDSLVGEKLRVSRIGYKTRELSVKDVEKQLVLYLAQASTNLNEVAVSAKKLKIKIVGNDTKTRSVTAGFTKNNLGTELAVKLNIKNPNTQLRRFFINIASNAIDTPLFRLNVYNLDKHGKPNENILQHNILFQPKEKTGLVELDLIPYNIYVNEDVFIAIEWVKDLGDVKGLSFSSKLIGSQTYFRQASQDKWEKLPSIGIGLHAEIGY